jgi:hypothetical protein
LLAEWGPAIDQAAFFGPHDQLAVRVQDGRLRSFGPDFSSMRVVPDVIGILTADRGHLTVEQTEGRVQATSFHAVTREPIYSFGQIPGHLTIVDAASGALAHPHLTLSDGSSFAPAGYPSNRDETNYSVRTIIDVPLATVVIGSFHQENGGLVDVPLVYVNGMGWLNTPGFVGCNFVRVEQAGVEGRAVQLTTADGRTYRLDMGSRPGFYVDDVPLPRDEDRLANNRALAALAVDQFQRNASLPDHLEDLLHEPVVVEGFVQESLAANLTIIGGRQAPDGQTFFVCRADHAIPNFRVAPIAEMQGTFTYELPADDVETV